MVCRIVTPIQTNQTKQHKSNKKMPATQVEVFDVEAAKKAADEAKAQGKDVIVLCTGNDDDSGKSWCPDCVSAKPVIEKVLKEHGTENHMLVVCKVGAREAWKTPDNAFRKHKDFAVKSIPTLFLWGTPQRLVEGECTDEGKVQLLFED